MSDDPTDEPGTDEPPTDGTSSGPSLAPDQEAEIRRLLVDARELEPMPDSVVARLDRVLAELSDQPVDKLSDGPVAGATGPGEPAPVTSLVTIRRQRAGRLLLAAAAVVVVGVGIGQLMDLGTGTGSGDDAATSAESQRGPGSQDRELTDSGAAGAAAPLFAVSRPVRVDPDRFSADVERARRIAASGNDGGKNQDGQVTGGAADFDCTPAAWGPGTFVPVRYDGVAGVLVFRSPTGSTQVVDLFQCGSANILRSITLTAP